MLPRINEKYRIVIIHFEPLYHHNISKINFLKITKYFFSALSINQPQHQTWQQTQARPLATPTPQATTEITTRVQMFNANLIPAPPIPPENIVTDQDKQAQILYEQWLNHQNNVLSQQLRYYETEVQKLRKSRKVS